MNKKVFAFCMAALLLTGCGSTAPAAGSSTAAESSSSAAPAKEESAGKEEKSEGAQDEIVTEFMEWRGYDMPIPPGMEIFDKARRLGYQCCWNHDTDNSVFLTFLQEYRAPETDKPGGYTLDDLPEVMVKEESRHLGQMLLSSINDDFSRVTIDSKSESQMLDYPLLRAEGTMNSILNDNINYIAYYGFLGDGGTDKMVIPSCWIAYTCSDSQDALDQMKQAAELPLTYAKLHEEKN